MAQHFDLTPMTYYEHTGSRKFLDHPANEGRSQFPHPILGLMSLKVLRNVEPQKRNGQPYSSLDIDYFGPGEKPGSLACQQTFIAASASVSPRQPSLAP
jgi:hypothetical protein